MKTTGVMSGLAAAFAAVIALTSCKGVPEYVAQGCSDLQGLLAKIEKTMPGKSPKLDADIKAAQKVIKAGCADKAFVIVLVAQIEEDLAAAKKK